MRHLAVALVLAIALPVAGAADEPLPNPSICPGCAGTGSPPPFIAVVGLQFPGATVAHSGHEFVAKIRDFAGQPVPGSFVEVDFTGCPDVVLCDVVPASETANVSCAGRRILGVTNALGEIRFHILGAGISVGTSGAPTPGSPTGCARVVADGVILSAVTPVVFDLNGAAPPRSAVENGMDVLDLTQFTVDLFSGIYFGRSDFSAVDADGCSGPAPDCGRLTVADLGSFATALFSSTGSRGGCATAADETAIHYCP